TAARGSGRTIATRGSSCGWVAHVEAGGALMLRCGPGVKVSGRPNMRRGPVRVRRGNYAILFVLTAAVMLSYLAFSIDGGRMKVAHVQAENASEAAGMAALAVVRDGGSRGEALAAARIAAERIMVMGSSSTSGSRFHDDLDWGRWDWNDSPEGDNLGVPWEDANSSTQAVTARVQVNGGITS